MSWYYFAGDHPAISRSVFVGASGSDAVKVFPVFNPGMDRISQMLFLQCGGLSRKKFCDSVNKYFVKNSTGSAKMHIGSR